MEYSDSCISISKIRLHSVFNNLFPKSPSVLNALKLHIQAHGFDDAFPLILAYGPWTEHDVLLDGHSRHQVCEELGLEEAPVVRRFFETEDEALEYMIHIQKDRRNLTDAEIVNCVATLDQRQTAGRHKKLASLEANFPTGKSAERTATILGVSRAKVERVRTILKHGDDEIKRSLQSGTSINKVYKEIQMKRSKSNGSIIEALQEVPEHVSLRMAPVEKVQAIDNGLEEDHDNLETLKAAHDSACNEIHVLTEPSIVPTCWALKVIDGFDPCCVDYIIVGQGTPPTTVSETQQVFLAPGTAPAQTEPSDTEDASNEEICPPTPAVEPIPVNPENLDDDGWYDLEQAWAKDIPGFVPDAPEDNAVGSITEGASFEQSSSVEPDMTHVPTDTNSIGLTAEVKTEATLDPRIAQILDLKAKDISNVIVKFLIRQGVCRIGSLGKILIDRDRLLSYLLERDANTLDGFTGLLTEFKAAPYIALPPDDDLQLELHHNFFDYPFGARWFWEQCSMKDDEGFLLSEGGFGANLLAFMAQHGLESLQDVVRRVAEIHEELRPRNSVSAGPDPQPFFSTSLNQYFAKRVDTPNTVALSAG